MNDSTMQTIAPPHEQFNQPFTLRELEQISPTSHRNNTIDKITPISNNKISLIKKQNLQMEKSQSKNKLQQFQSTAKFVRDDNANANVAASEFADIINEVNNTNTNQQQDLLIRSSAASASGDSNFNTKSRRIFNFHSKSNDILMTRSASISLQRQLCEKVDETYATASKTFRGGASPHNNRNGIYSSKQMEYKQSKQHNQKHVQSMPISALDDLQQKNIALQHDKWKLEIELTSMKGQYQQCRRLLDEQSQLEASLSMHNECKVIEENVRLRRENEVLIRRHDDLKKRHLYMKEKSEKLEQRILDLLKSRQDCRQPQLVQANVIKQKMQRLKRNLLRLKNYMKEQKAFFDEQIANYQHQANSYIKSVVKNYSANDFKRKDQFQQRIKLEIEKNGLQNYYEEDAINDQEDKVAGFYNRGEEMSPVQKKSYSDRFNDVNDKSQSNSQRKQILSYSFQELADQNQELRSKLREIQNALLDNIKNTNSNQKAKKQTIYQCASKEQENKDDSLALCSFDSLLTENDKCNSKLKSNLLRKQEVMDNKNNHKNDGQSNLQLKKTDFQQRLEQARSHIQDNHIKMLHNSNSFSKKENKADGVIQGLSKNNLIFNKKGKLHNLYKTSLLLLQEKQIKSFRK